MRHLRLRLLIPVALCLGLVCLLRPISATALSGSDFKASNIVDDGVFFNPGALSAADVQAFLNAKVPVCDTNGTQMHTSTQTRAQWSAANGKQGPPYTCLKDYSENVPFRAADAYCDGSVSAGTKTAAQIINDVSRACGVSQKVLLVLLQKEQILVTDDWPLTIQYTKATGFGCPDSDLGSNVDSNNNGCYDDFEGFFNQIYYGARQYQRYAKEPDLFNYAAGQTSYVAYQVANVSGCGGTNITIQGAATAGLYNYTPYQPNAAALNNLYGTGDRCSAYGNRNFWRMFSDWFGSTQTNTPFEWSYAGQSIYSDADRERLLTDVPTFAPNATVYGQVRARNIGNQTWFQNVILGTTHPNNRSSQFADSSWWNNNSRAAHLLETSISPGLIGTFDFNFKAPSTAGTYKEYFNPLIEGQTWFNDPGLFFTINVVSPTAPAAVKHTLATGEFLNPGQMLMSQDKQSVLILQPDGNLVLYEDFVPKWHSRTAGTSPGKLTMQASDGNLVLRDSSGKAVWSPHTETNPGAYLKLQTDGNLVVYRSNNTAVKSVFTGSFDIPATEPVAVHNPDRLSYVNTSFPEGVLYPGQQIETADRKFRAVLQSDGNFVLYAPSGATWSSKTAGKPAATMRMQSDGNLVLRDADGKTLWHTFTYGRGRSVLTMQPDGNLVLRDGSGRATWSSQTAGLQ